VLEYRFISAEVKTKASELGLDQKQSALLKIAKAKGADAQLQVIEEIQSAKASASNTAAPGKRKKNRKSSEPSANDEAGTDELNESDSPPLAPEDSEEQGLDGPDHLDDRTEKDRLFAELKAAWDNAPRSVRRRFVRKVLGLDPDDISEEIFTA
jgi:hypothetical protein